MKGRINQKLAAFIKQVYPDSVNITVEAKLVPDHPECSLFYTASVCPVTSTAQIFVSLV